MLTSDISKAVFEGNGAATQFPFEFKVWDTTQLRVEITTPYFNAYFVDNWTATLTATGGVVSYVHEGAPLPAGYIISIIRDMPFLQETDLVNGTRFDPEVMETQLDKAAAERQQLREAVSQTLKIPYGSNQSSEDFIKDFLEAKADSLINAEKAEISAGKAFEYAAESKAWAEDAKSIVTVSESHQYALEYGQMGTDLKRFTGDANAQTLKSPGNYYANITANGAVNGEQFIRVLNVDNVSVSQVALTANSIFFRTISHAAGAQATWKALLTSIPSSITNSIAQAQTAANTAQSAANTANTKAEQAIVEANAIKQAVESSAYGFPNYIAGQAIVTQGSGSIGISALLRRGFTAPSDGFILGSITYRAPIGTHLHVYVRPDLQSEAGACEAYIFENTMAAFMLPIRGGMVFDYIREDHFDSYLTHKTVFYPSL